MNETTLNNIVNNMKNEDLNMETLYITCKDKEYKYVFNNKDEELKNVRSISKTVTSIALGIAIDKGYFKNGIEEYIMDYLSDVNITNKDNIKYLKETRIKHLITLSMGYEDMILNEGHLKELGDIDILEYALNYPIKHKPGEYFKYTNAPIYILSVIIEKATKMKLSEFVYKEIFSKIEINDFKWVECSKGHSMGCTGLTIFPKDLHKLGKLLLNKGMYNNEQIIPINWLNEMTKLQIYTPDNYDESRALPKFGYGYNLWICKNCIYYHDGSDGQYLIVIPDKDIVITTTATQKHMKYITKCMEELFK